MTTALPSIDLQPFLARTGAAEDGPANPVFERAHELPYGGGGHAEFGGGRGERSVPGSRLEGLEGTQARQ